MVAMESNIEICDNEDMAVDVAAVSMLVDGLSVDVDGNPVEVMLPAHLVAECVNGPA